MWTRKKRINIGFLVYTTRKYEEMFVGTFRKYVASDYTIELRKNKKPYHTNPFVLLEIMKQILRKK